MECDPGVGALERDRFLRELSLKERWVRILSQPERSERTQHWDAMNSWLTSFSYASTTQQPSGP